MTLLWGFVIVSIVLGAIRGILEPPKRKRRKKQTRSTNKHSKSNKSASSSFSRSSKTCRPDEELLLTPLDEINGTEFERLLALYFKDRGYKVHEVGVGGNDGGVDLVIVDKRGERTAVQAKCYAETNAVNVQTVRELVGAKRNHNCVLSLLITTSDLTGPAKKEAELLRVEYWHGAVIERKLTSWGKWKPSKRGKQRA
ncbi:restriction system protein [Paenibacillus cellulosilyticus]|uniref:Restriction system protein n=1 Tax=Paenibacillus cellulosilyticus TaxID=375489 RepID=A0A2V2YZR9_9BACL|nr:restriction endonuclease [Paenibacillus cellulosilyticus]PWW08619.1 restriction system protein [Paenibacillus cellulosilyticus]